MTTTTAAPTGEAAPPARTRDVSHAIWWGLFAVGGMTAAILVPVHILIQGVLGPLGIVPSVSNRYETFSAALANPLVRLYFLVLISLPLFHAAHRLRSLIVDLGITGGQQVVATLLYAGAILGTLVAAYVLVTLP
jgi:fumarate reductase subunit D